MGKQSSGGTQTTTMEPPDYIKPYLQQAAQSAFGLYAGPGVNVAPQAGADGRRPLGGLGVSIPTKGGSTVPQVDPFSAWTPEYFPGSTVSPFSGATNAALTGITDRAMNGSPLVDQAQQFVQQGLGAPISSDFGSQVNPYAAPVDPGAAGNPFAAPVGTNTQANPYASPVGVQQVAGGPAENPYATSANPFGGASNPYLDATYDKAFGKAMQSVESQFARGGRNIGAAQPVAGDIASSLASQIYAPAYENERNRQASYAQQQLGIGANSFDAGQNRALQAGMANQSAGLTAGLAGQQIGAGSFENQRAQQLQAALAGQQIGAGSFENAQGRQLQANLAGQQIGAQGFENAQNRQLSDLTAQRQMQQGLLGYASPLAAQDYLDLAQLQGAGQMYDSQNQAQLNDQIARWDYQQNRPGMALDSLLARLSGMPGSTQTTQLPNQNRNVGAGLLGGGLAGSQLAPLLGVSGPVGIGLGALLGGLF